MKRRGFLSLSAGSLVSAPIILNQKSLLFAATTTSPIAIAFHDQASSLTLNCDGGDAVKSYTVNSAHVAAMVDDAIMALAQKNDLGLAWESFFPAGKLTASTKIAIKVNTSYGINDGSNDWSKTKAPFAPKVEVLNAMASGLTRMLGGTFPIENITVFDKHLNEFGEASNVSMGKLVQQGFPPDPTGFPYDVSGAGKYRVVLVDVYQTPSNAPSFTAGPNKVSQQMLPPVYQNDFLIDLANPKDHSCAGYTGVLKNFFGATKSCISFGHDAGLGGNSVGMCVLDVFKNITEKTPCVLYFLDALGGIYNGGPVAGGKFLKNAIAVSRDPLALDHYGLTLVNEARIKYKMSAITYGASDPASSNGHPNAVYLGVGAQSPYSFGNLNSDERIVHDMTGIRTPQTLPPLEIPQFRLLNVVRTSSGYRMDVALDASGRRFAIESALYDVRGRCVRHLMPIATTQALTVLEWDGKNNAGITAASGVYSWEVRANGRTYYQSIHHSL